MGSRRTWADNVYKAASKWVDSALRTDGSLFTPGKPIWSGQWLGELRRSFLNHPDGSAGDSFLKKLERQLTNSRPEAYQLMGEALYVYFLIDLVKNSDNEQKTINTVLGWTPSPVAIPPDLVAGLVPGLVNLGPGVQYRPFQVGFIIEFVEQWKEQSSACIRLLDAPWEFKKFLNNIPLRSRLLSNSGNRYRAQREAILHLVFPDTFEPIISFNHKKKIVNAFASLVKEPTDDVDRQLQQIREGLTPKYSKNFSFYDELVKGHWKGKNPAAHQLINTVKSHLVIDPEGGNAFTIEGVRSQRRSGAPRWKGISRADRIALVDSAIAEFTGGTDTTGAAELVAADRACKSYRQRLIDKLGEIARRGDTLADDWADLRKTLMAQVDSPKVPRDVLPALEPVDLQALAGELLFDVDSLQKIEKLLNDKRQVIFQGPPGTGKTYVARKLADCLSGSQERVRLVQFHPSYAYEDFVQGYRPRPINGQTGFEIRDGPLLEAAKRARTEPAAKHFLIIDEINRGNLSKVFGELYFLLEYRDEEMRLLYDDKPFSLPDNLYIIGTMNTADRSIALVDLALRRRFHFVEFHPDKPPVKGLLRRWLKKNAADMDGVANVVERANEKLRDRQAAIGPSYFIKPGLDKEMLHLIWEHNVLPYVEEHLYGEHDLLDAFRLDKLWSEALGGDEEQKNATTADGPTNTDD